MQDRESQLQVYEGVAVVLGPQSLPSSADCGFCRGLILGGQHEGTFHIGLAVLNGYVAKNICVDCCALIVVPLSGLAVKDGVDKGFAAQGVAPMGCTAAQKFDAADAVGNSIVVVIVDRLGSRLRSAEAADRLNEVVLDGQHVFRC